MFVAQRGYGAEVYFSVSRLRVEPERSAALVAAFRRRAGLVDSHLAFLVRYGDRTAILPSCSS
jgi:hypothetical protein